MPRLQPVTILWTMECQLRLGSLEILTCLTCFNKTLNILILLIPPFHLETSLKEFLAIADILFLATDGSQPRHDEDIWTTCLERCVQSSAVQIDAWEHCQDQWWRFYQGGRYKSTLSISKTKSVREGQAWSVELGCNNEQNDRQCHWRVSKPAVPFFFFFDEFSFLLKSYSLLLI